MASLNCSRNDSLLELPVDLEKVQDAKIAPKRNPLIKNFFYRSRNSSFLSNAATNKSRQICSPSLKRQRSKTSNILDYPALKLARHKEFKNMTTSKNAKKIDLFFGGFFSRKNSQDRKNENDSDLETKKIPTKDILEQSSFNLSNSFYRDDLRTVANKSLNQKLANKKSISTKLTPAKSKQKFTAKIDKSKSKREKNAFKKLLQRFNVYAGFRKESVNENDTKDSISSKTPEFEFRKFEKSKFTMAPENETIVIDDSTEDVELDLKKDEKFLEKTSDKSEDDGFAQFLREAEDDEGEEEDQDSGDSGDEENYVSDSEAENYELSEVGSSKKFTTELDDALSKLKIAKDKSKSLNVQQSIIKARKHRKILRGQPLLTEDDMDEAEQLINYTPDHITISSAFRLEVKGKNARTLASRAWLDDEIINFYMEMINDRARKKAEKDPENAIKVWACNTFFFTTYTTQGYSKVRRWTKRQKIDVFELDYMIIPVHLSVHWTCCVIDMKTREIIFYDSMRPSRNSNHGDNYCQSMLEYLKEEHKDKKGSPLKNVEDFQIYTDNHNPQQNNGSDCGVFTCCMAENVSRSGRLNFNFSYKEMEDIRKKMIIEIKNKEIFDPVE